MKTIGERIKKVRKKKGMTQSEFADKLCLSRTHITNIENGKDNVSGSVIRLISILFDISEDWVKTGVSED